VRKLKKKQCGICQSEDVEYKVLSTKIMLNNYIDDLEVSLRGKVKGCKTTGNQHMDWLLNGGLAAGDFVVVAGLTSSLRESIAYELLISQLNNSMTCGLSSKRAGITRMLQYYTAKHTDIPLHKIQSAHLDESEWLSVNSSIRNINKQNKLIALEVTSLTINGLVAGIKKLKKENEGLDTLLIDECSYISPFISVCDGFTSCCLGRLLKSLAKELNIQIILLTSISELMVESQNYEVNYEDIKPEYNLVDYADILMLCHRPEIYQPELVTNTDTVELRMKGRGRLGTLKVPIKHYHIVNLTHAMQAID